jgi:hypothetical protein
MPTVFIDALRADILSHIFIYRMDMKTKKNLKTFSMSILNYYASGGQGLFL